MRQVPTYLLIGSGRVATHFQRYLDLLQLPFQTWSRRQNTADELRALSDECSPILLLISDKAIPEFLEQYPFLKGKLLVHCSGCLSVPGVHAAHPLTSVSFTPACYDLETYQQIPFVLGESSPDLSQLMPGLPNKRYRLPEHLRSYYHALCVMSGNFTTLLWQKLFKEVEERFQFPKEMTHHYLKQIMNNLLNCSQQALTGPLARGDQTTINANLQALDQDSHQGIYQAFVDAYVKTHLKS